MPGPADFVDPVLTCVNASFDWPDITAPGFPTVVIGSFGSLFAGIDFTLDFLPPSPFNIPTIPDISLFIDGFFAFAVGMPGFPATTIQVPGVPDIPLPAFAGPTIPGFDPSVMLNLIGLFIAAPFLIIKGIILSIIDLNIQIPDLPTIEGIIISAGLSLGFPQASLDLFVPCLAQGFLDALGVLPV